VEGSNSPYLINYSNTWKSSTELEISVSYSTALIGDGTEYLKVRITNPYDFISTQNVPMTKNEKFTVELSAEQQESAMTSAAGATAQYGMMTSFAVSAGSNVVLGSSMEKMWSLINTCQLIFYLGLVSVYFPNHVVSFFGFLKMANMDNQFLASMTEDTIGEQNEDRRGAVNYRYNRLGYETISFVDNASDLISLAVLIIVCTVLFAFVT
jgi:hypothetical protein